MSQKYTVSSKIEKEANAAARKVKGKAYRARRKSYSDAEDSIEKHPDVVSLRAKADRFDEELSRLMEARDLKISEIRRQIYELNAQIVTLTKDPKLDEVHKMRTAAYAKWRELVDELNAQLRLQFKDLIPSDGCIATEAGWSPPAEVVEEIEAARKAVLSGN